LYPALHRLEQQGLIAAEWGNSENNRQLFYELTKLVGSEAHRGNAQL
jgi:DNA-binding PadR family transcriptional regulator